MMCLSRFIFALPVSLHQLNSLKSQPLHHKITGRESAAPWKQIRVLWSPRMSRKLWGMMKVNELSHSVLFSTPGQVLMENRTRFYLSVFRISSHSFAVHFNSTLTSYDCAPFWFSFSSYSHLSQPPPPSTAEQTLKLPHPFLSDLLHPPSASVYVLWWKFAKWIWIGSGHGSVSRLTLSAPLWSTAKIPLFTWQRRWGHWFLQTGKWT